MIVAVRTDQPSDQAEQPAPMPMPMPVIGVALTGIIGVALISVAAPISVVVTTMPMPMAGVIDAVMGVPAIIGVTGLSHALALSLSPRWSRPSPTAVCWA